MANVMSRILLMSLVVILLCAGPAVAAEDATVEESPAMDAELEKPINYSQVFGVLGGLLSSGIIVFGAALGISRIARGATEAISRQPEAGGRIMTTMVIAASLIEGVAFFGLIVCFVSLFLLT